MVVRLFEFEEVAYTSKHDHRPLENGETKNLREKVIVNSRTLMRRIGEIGSLFLY